MTEQTAGFCPNCGAELVAGNTFCTGCGSPTASAPAPPPSPSSAEQIVTVMAGLTIASGFMGLKHTAYTLVITNTRLVFAQLTSAMLKAAIEDARADTKSEGGGFFKQWGAQMGAAFSYAERYWQMTPDVALAETPGNFMIDRRTIEKMKLHAGMTRDEGADDPDYITIKAAGTKYKLLLTGGTLARAKEELIKAGLI